MIGTTVGMNHAPQTPTGLQEECTHPLTQHQVYTCKEEDGSYARCTLISVVFAFKGLGERERSDDSIVTYFDLHDPIPPSTVASALAGAAFPLMGTLLGSTLDAFYPFYNEQKVKFWR